MRIYRIPSSLSGILFDIDGTLYRHERYLNSMTELLVRRLAEHRGIAVGAAMELVREQRRAWGESHGGRRPPLGQVFLELGIPMEQSVAWREELFEPERFLRADAALRDALTLLRSACTLCALTNNPRLIGARTLEVLGVADLFSCLVGLDDTLRSKPAAEPFTEALGRMGCEAAEVLSVGDRYEVDVETALAMGMGGIVVDEAAELYRLPEILNRRSRGGGQ